jgi:hypothetical protein
MYQREFTAIAVVGGTDIPTQKLVVKILTEAHIEARLEGSVVYTVSVSQAKAKKAKDLLMEDLRMKGRWIRFQ